MSISERDYLEKDYYQVLGVARDATHDEIAKAYRKLARQLHPDAHPDDPEAEERFKRVGEAYEVLGDLEKRNEYDEARELLGAGAHSFGVGAPRAGRVRIRFDQGSTGGRAGWSRFGESPPGDDAFDLDDLFGDVLARQRRRSGAQGGAAAPRRGADLEADVTLPFGDAIRGATTTIQVAFPSPCPSCSGSGHQLASHLPCAECAGRGVVEQTEQMRVRIPAGVRDNARIRLPGKGSPGRLGGARGDLLLRVHVEPHTHLRRRGDDLELTVPVTFTEAALGAEISVPTLDGPVTVKVPAGTNSGRKLRVRGRGVPKPSGERGDLLVNVEVVVPARLTKRQRELLEEFARTETTSVRDHLAA